MVVPQSLHAAALVDPAETSSDGLAVETYVLARLLGIKLLTLEGLVLVSPAAVRRSDGPPTSRPRRATERLPTRDGSRRTPSTKGSGPGSGLVGAARLLDQCAEELRALGASRVELLNEQP
jgi:hypothetical protein